MAILTALQFLKHLPFLHYFSLEYVKHHTTNRVINWIVWANMVAVKSKILLKNVYQDSVLVKNIVNNVCETIKPFHEVINETHKTEKEHVWINIITYVEENRQIDFVEHYRYLSLENTDGDSGISNDKILHELVNEYNEYKENIHMMSSLERLSIMPIRGTEQNEDDEEMEDENEEEHEEDFAEEEEEEKEQDTVSEVSICKDSDGESIPDLIDIKNMPHDAELTTYDNGVSVFRHFMSIIKYYNRKSVRIGEACDDIPITMNPSSVKFISIEYMHENMEEAIELHLPKDYYTEGNQLFSPMFVLYLLKMQSNPFYFDTNYTLFIIDNSANMFQIHSNKYILIEKDSYKVLDVK